MAVDGGSILVPGGVQKKAALSGLKGTCSDETVAFTMNFNDIQESPGDIHVNT